MRRQESAGAGGAKEVIDHLSPQLLEASNGILFCVLCLMLGGALSYLFMELREGGPAFVYKYRGAGIALTVFLSGFVTRTALIWWSRHAQNHGIAQPPWMAWGPEILSASTLVIVAGGICWVRVTSWRELGGSFWLAAAALSILVGIILALP